MDAIFDIQRFANNSAELSVIKKFMAALDTTTLSGTAALNEAVKACSNFSTAQEAINQLISDQNKAASTSDFLLNYCGINLNNSDTGAITGSDAGGSVTKTATSVVPESSSSSYPSSTTFTKRGLTVTVPSKSTLTSTQQVIVQGLYSWWIEEALKIVEESTGYSFTDDDATVAKISIEFTDDSTSGSLAYISNYWDTSNSILDKLTKMSLESGITTKLKLTINSAYFSNLTTSNVDGLSNYGYLDRTIAHELTHAIMAAKVNYHNNLPTFIKEGLAELVHGADDTRKSDINYLAGNSSALQSALSLNSSSANYYSSTAGYILLRYLAKQAATDPNSNVNIISNSTSNTVINGTSGNDSIYNYYGDYTTINSGSGDDTIYDISGDTKIFAGAGNDSIYHTTGYDITIDGGAGDDSITMENLWAYSISINGGEGNDKITLKDYVGETSYYSGLSVKGGTGNDTVYANEAQNNAVVYQYANGDGNDTIYGFKSSDMLQITGAKYTTVTSGGGADLLFKVGNGSILIKNVPEVAFIVDGTLDSGGELYIEGTSGADNIKNSLTGATINALAGNDSISNTGTKVSIYGGNGNDYIRNTNNYLINYSLFDSTISGGAGNDKIENEIENVLLFGDTGNDSIYNSGSYSKISAGDGEDYINNNAAYTSINGGAGNDEIILYNYVGVTVNAGKGNDNIFNYYGSNIYQYANGDGNDSITGIQSNDTIKITGAEYEKVTLSSSNDVTLKVGSGSILVKNAKNISFTVDGTIKSDFTEGNDNYTNTNSNVYLNALGGNDYIYNDGKNVKIFGGAGNDEIYTSSISSGVYIEGGNGADSIHTYLSNNSTILGGAGNETIWNSGDNVYIDGGSDNDAILTYYNNGTVHGGAGNDSIGVNESGKNILVYGDAGNDYIHQWGTSATLNGGAGNDSILLGYGSSKNFIQYSNGDGNDSITGIQSNDTIKITGAEYTTTTSGNDLIIGVGSGSITVSGGANVDFTIDGTIPSDFTEGNDNYTNTKSNVYLNALAGNDTVQNDGDKVTVDAGAGNDSIHNHGDSVSIYGGAGDDTLWNCGDNKNVTLNGGAGKDSIANNGTNAQIDGGTDADYIYNSANNSKMNGGAGNDTVNNNGGINVTISGNEGNDTIQNYKNSSTVNGGDSVKIDGGDGADLVNNWGNKTTILGGNGNDTIYNYKTLYMGSTFIADTLGNNVQIDGGAGADKVIISGSNVTISGGRDNDIISLLSDSSNNFIQYANDDGNDTVYGVDSNDTVKITGAEYEKVTTASSNDVTLKVGNGSILVKNAKNIPFTIDGQEKSDVINLTSGNDNYSNSENNVTINALAGNDSIYNEEFGQSADGGPDEVYIDGGTGNDYIANTGDKSTLIGGAGKDSIFNYKAESNGTVTVADSLGNNVVMLGGDDNDYIYNGGPSSVSIDGDAGADTIRVYYGGKLTINGGNDNDSIVVELSGYSSINGGAGNDLISLSNSYNETATIQGGTGNDTIYGDTVSHFYQYSSGDGNDIIHGINKNDTIKITGAEYEKITTASSNDVTLKVGSDSILVKDAKNISFTVDGTIPSVDDLNISNTRANTVINGAGGSDSIRNYADNVKVFAGAGNDTVYTVGDKFTLNGEDGDDYIYTWYGTSNVVVNGGAGKDSLHVGSDGATVEGGADDDYIHIYANSKNNIITDSAGNDTVESGGQFITIESGIGNDYILFYTNAINQTVNAGAGNDSIYSGGQNISLSGGADNDYIHIYSEAVANTVDAGAGNDTIQSYSTLGTLYQYKSGDGNDLIKGYTSNDTITITGGSFKKSTVGNDVLISVDNGTVTLSGAKGKTININPRPQNSTNTPLDVIQTFMDSLDKSTIKASGSLTDNQLAVKMLDEAVKVISANSTTKYASIQKVIDKMIADCKAYNTADSSYGWQRFLLEKCDIDLTNDDTGAITGSDALGLSSAYDKSADSIVQESGNVDRTFEGNEFYIDSLKLYLDKDFSSLSSAEKYIWQGLHSWWVDSSLDLIAASYGNNFSYGSESSSTIEDTSIKVEFIYEKSGLNAQVISTFWVNSGVTFQERLQVNMYKYNSIHIGDENGENDKTYVTSNIYYPATYLDRTLAHEFTHGVMGANIRFHSGLPQFITDGMAELVHGIDDQRGDTIESLTKDPESLNKALNVNYTENKDINAYSAGYIFLRYVAKQFSDRANPNALANASEVIQTVFNVPTGLSVKGDLLTAAKTYKDNKISLSDFESTVTKVNTTVLSADMIILGNADDNSVKAGKGNDSLYGGAGRDTLYGGTGADALFGGSGNDNLYGDAGDDTLYGGIDNDTLTGGAGNDIFIYEDGNDVITDYSTGDKIQLVGAAITNSSLSGNNVILKVGSKSITVKDAKGKNITVIDGEGNETTTIYGGTSNDTVGLSVKNSIVTADKTFTGNEINLANIDKATKVNAASASHGVSIIGTSGNNSIKGSKYADTISGGAGNDTVSLGGGNDIYIYSSGNDLIQDYAAADKISLASGSVSSASVSSSNVILNISNGGKISVKGGKGKQITIVNSNGKETVYGGTSTETLTTGLSVSNSVLTAASTFKGKEIKLADFTNATSVNASVLSQAVSIVGSAKANSIFGGKGADKIYGGTGNDTLKGNAGADSLFGEAGNDKLYGDAGNDSLSGGTGNDTLTGGAGKDVFIFSGGKDVITDYTASDDKIKISSGTISKTTYSGSNVVFTIGSGSLTVKDGKGKKITITDSSGKTTTKTYNTGVSARTLDLLEDNNFISNDTNLDSITECKVDVTEVQPKNNFTLAQDSSFLTFTEEK